MKRAFGGDAVPAAKRERINDQGPPFVSSFDLTRARLLSRHNILPQSGECVILHMSRDQRVEDNYAMIYAQSLAISRNVPLKVVFHLAPQFLEMTMRHYHFMLTGLMEVEQDLRSEGNPVLSHHGRSH